MEDKKLNIQLEENDISQNSLEDNLIDSSSNLCDSSCFKAVKQLLEDSDKKAEFEEFFYMVHMRDNQLMDIKDKLSDLEVKLSIYKQQILEKNKLIDNLKRKIYLSDEAKINNNERTITETNNINAETIKAKDQLIETLKESLKLSKDNRKLWDSNQLAMTTRIDLLLAQQATANENMIEKDNEIVRLKSKTDTNEVEIKENIKIIDEMKNEIKALEDTVLRQNSTRKELCQLSIRTTRKLLFEKINFRSLIEKLDFRDYSALEMKSLKVNLSRTLDSIEAIRKTIAEALSAAVRLFAKLEENKNKNSLVVRP